MKLLSQGAFPMIGLALIAALIGCSGGGPNVPASYPSPTATGVAATPTATPSAATSASTSPTPSATSSASANPTPSATASPSSSPTPLASGSPMASPTATPTASSTATPVAQCPPPMPYPSPASTTVAFTMNGSTIALPSYQDATGSAQIPPVTSGLPASVTIKLGRANFDSAPNPGNGTPELYATLVLQQPSGGSGSLTFASSNIPVSITSPCSISAGHTYNVYAYAAGSQIEAQTGLTPSGDTVNASLVIPPLYMMMFQTNVTVDIVATQS